jgi:hypothetical protein
MDGIELSLGVVTKIPDSRAAEKRWDVSPTANVRVFVHAVLLSDPARPWTRYKARRFRSLREPEHIEYAFDAPEAVCGRRVRLVYPMSFDDEEDDACPDCLKLIAIWQIDPEEYRRQARIVEQEIEQRERSKRERQRAQTEAKRLFEALDESDDEEPPPDLMDLLERADRDNPDSSHTA